MPEARERHTMFGDISCGGNMQGYDHQPLDTCISMVRGDWKETHKMLVPRSGHVSWKREEGVVLFGGFSKNTKLLDSVELIKSDRRRPQELFKLEHKAV